MVNKILKTLSKNLGFKILAVVFAFTLWVTVYNLDDPTKTKSLTVNATVTNKQVLEDMGKYYEIEEGNKVSFSVTAPRSILDKLDESDFVAEANLQKIQIDDEGNTATVPIEIICTENQNGNSVKISSTSKTLVVSLEDLMIKQFVVQASAVGEVAEGYALGKVEVTAPNVLQVSGPKSIVSQISTVIAMVDVNGMSDSSTTYRTVPIFIDEDGNEMDTTRLTLSDNTVNVEAEILNMMKALITAETSGQVAEGYAVTGVSANPESVFLKGNKAVLNSVSEIRIPSDVISVEGADKDVTVVVDVSEYLPEGVELAVSEQANIEITVSIDKVKTKSYSINTENVVVIGLPTHATIEYALSSLAVNVTGLETDINVLTSQMLMASIDVTDLGVGTHEVELVLDLDENKYSYETVKVEITIAEEIEADEGGTVTGDVEGSSDGENTGNDDVVDDAGDAG